MLDAAPLQCQLLTIQTETGKQTVLARADIEAWPHSWVTAGAPDSPVRYDVVTLKTLLEKGDCIPQTERQKAGFLSWWKPPMGIVW